MEGSHAFCLSINKNLLLTDRAHTHTINICCIYPFPQMLRLIYEDASIHNAEEHKKRILCSLNRIRSFKSDVPSPIGKFGSILLGENTLRNVQYQQWPNLDAYNFDIINCCRPFAEVEKGENICQIKGEYNVPRCVEQTAMSASGVDKKDTQRKDHRNAYKPSLEDDLLDRKSNRRNRSKSTKREKRKANKRGYKYIPQEEYCGKKGKRREIRPAIRPNIDRSDVSALYDFDEGILSSMGVSNKNDRKCLGEVARCIFRMKNDMHDHVESRISGVDPSDKVLVFSLIYKGSVPLDFSEQQAVKDACGPRFKNIRCVTVPFDSEAERRQFQMSCITQIVIDMVKKKYVTQVHHHHHHHH